MDDGRLSALHAKQVNASQRLQGGFGHAHRAGVEFGLAVVNFVAPLPNTVVGGAVGSANVVHQVFVQS